MNDKIFIANDLDLNFLDKESLKVCCEFSLLVETEYPKLVIYLFQNNKFHEWLNSNNINCDNMKIIKSLINAIRLRTLNISGELIIKEINLLDKELWLSIVDQFISEETLLNKKNRNLNSSGIIIRRKRSLKKVSNQNVFIDKGKDISISI